MNPWIVLVSLAALIFYFATGLNVAGVRKKHGIMPPAMSGHAQVECALRVQGNTLEWLVIFLPALWLFGLYWPGSVAAGLGLAWIAGRYLYMTGYMKDPNARYPGFFIQTLACTVLVIGAAIGAVKGLI